MILKILAKKHVKDVLKLLNSKDMYFSELQKTLNLHPKILDSILSDLVNEGFVEKREGESPYKFGKVYYSITPRGKRALEILDLIETFDTLREGQDIVINYKIVNSTA
ncbi:hypothetical protein MJ_0361 [Methanocaldococcus jannaschii DSM 2661]|uniref:Uncharacterized HTH-type transcriptional regulator MJ0361 n=1 Tax=Methanocaldococcus jannaschii (strain ATCC 43067 / DSM 2661 / JAL-1 / JCM 10045 / NBRC 100440) TaxID=243232 RepID=Y361_METJA|nr:helix-turn-helix domain-containing protein [Methanocaldococcus jannaschii]Q57807.1 RecName: Full=Uncharacterized HTH-type transcriptional regulator MJ0361 [Methanocaldococcus jannaschii DSM 2661]AAB98353.1 hypothetical protein MJ_0361 [Methanocaldococcus jannaschii DSM 2661]